MKHSVTAYSKAPLRGYLGGPSICDILLFPPPGENTPKRRVNSMEPDWGTRPRPALSHGGHPTKGNGGLAGHQEEWPLPVTTPTGWPQAPARQREGRRAIAAGRQSLRLGSSPN